MNKLVLLLLSLVLIGLVACAGNNYIKHGLTGRVYVAGNEPFTFLAIESSQGEIFKISCSDSLKKELWRFQGEEVKLKLTEIQKLDTIQIAVVKSYKLKEQK